MQKKIKNIKWLDVTYIPLLITAVLTVGVTFLVYNETQSILQERLREKLVAIASTAALQFDANKLELIKDRSSISNPEFKEVIDILNEIRDVNKNVSFVYLLRPTADENKQTFIADADTLASLEEIDTNENGILDDEENPPYPGLEYDSSNLPALKETLSGVATADHELNSDEWGTFLSGYAPIFLEDKLIAILGIDIEVSDFQVIVQATLIPFIALSGTLLFILLILTIILSKIWNGRVELVKEIDRQKDDLLSIVSHQLATPVSSIKWYLEMLKDGDLGPLSKEQGEHITSMQSAAVNLADLVSMILDVSRIQLGRIHIEKQELDLDGFYKEILEIIRPKAVEKKVKFIENLPVTLGVAKLDRRYTHMTIENLLSNAIKYTPENGNVELNVAIKNKMMLVSVKDTGCGIPKNEQSKIFGKLFRASNVKNTVDGNGFGLYVAKGAVEAQGGKIRFESTEGKGTTFFIELPLE